MRLEKRAVLVFGAMSRRPALVVLAVVGVLLLASVIAIFHGIWTRQTSAAASVREDALWTTYLIDREIGRTIETLGALLDGRPGVTLAEVGLRFDILYSRHEVMEEGDFPTKFLADPILSGLSEEISDRLHALIPVFDRIESANPPDLVELAVVRQNLVAAQVLTGDLLVATNRVRADIQVDERAAMTQDFQALAAAVGGLTLAMGAVIWLIWRQMAQLEISRRRLQILSEELKSSAEAATAGNRAKSAFLATMSHEIRTPLNGIVGMAELMASECTDPGRHEQLETIRRCAEGLCGLIDDVLDFSRLESGSIELEMRPVVIGDVIEDVVDMCVPRIEGRDIVLVASHPIAAYETDPTRLRQVLFNLVGNAVKFTERGTVAVVARERRSKSRGTTLRFEVEDTGIGIEPEIVGRLFGEFTQADASIRRRFGGSGLGLAISRRLVEAFGGRIGVTSRPGQGSIFWFEIPVKPAAIVLPRPTGRLVEIDVVDRHAKVVSLLAHDLGHLAPSVDAVLREGRSTRWTLVDVASYEASVRDGAGFDASRTIVHGIGARRHAGEVAEVAEGAMTTGRLARILARVSGSPLPSRTDTAATRAARAVPAGERGRVLVVEDNEVNRRVVVGLLGRLGFTCEIATDGAKAVDRLTRPGIDIVVMDMQMPVMDGLEATTRIRAAEGADQRVPIVGLTANAFASDRAQCLEAGMDDFLVKPVTRDRLAAALDRFAKDPGPQTAPTEVASDADAIAAAPPIAEGDGGPLVDRDRRRLLVAELDRETLDELTRIFWSDAEALGTELARALADGDLPAFRRHLHTLKGAAANVGLPGIVEAIDRLRRSEGSPSAEDVGRLSAALSATRLAQIADDAELAAAA
jgi:signal transduction histidine kinase/CheY-like chemotaxis protein